MKRALLLSIFIIPVMLAVTGQREQSRHDARHLRVAFYNVENLFDTIDNPLTNDADFLPDGRIPWTTERYERKLDRMAEVINALGTSKPAAVIGLCEVENKAVLEDLVSSPRILHARYHIIHRESPDERGIDNALLYDPAQFQPLHTATFPVLFPFSPEDKTRDILYVKGIHPKNKKDTLHVFVNHWPSRSEGREISEPKRLRAAEVLKSATDSLFRINGQCLIILLGDFNDEPSDRSLSETLQALPATVENRKSQQLYNLMYPAYLRGEGTIYWKDWDMFDMVILSGNFWNKPKGIRFSGTEGEIFTRDWLMYQGNDGELRPNRTAAREYYGGYSDHLPVFVDLILK